MKLDYRVLSTLKIEINIDVAYLPSFMGDSNR